MLMGLKNEFIKMIEKLSSQFAIPPVSTVFFPPFFKGGQPQNAQFMAIGLEGGTMGISYILLSDEKIKDYTALQPNDFIGKDPKKFALEFGSTDPIREMISLAAINAICQHVMKTTRMKVESTTDSLGLLAISKGDRVGMVGLFHGMVKTIRDAGAQLVVIEKNQELIKKYSDLPITMDTGKLKSCNKVLCTSTTILNNSLDEVLGNCSDDAFVSIVGPTAGYFPDPLFARGVDVVGGTVVNNGDQFMQRIAQGQPWGTATQRTCFQKKTYTGL
jgi:uncharacterized protein (DUF4213/DUF364 family)